MNIFFLLSRLTSQCKNLLLICCCLDPGHQLLVNILQLNLDDEHPTPKICEFLGFVPGIPKEAGNVRVKVYNQYFLNVPTNLALWQDNDSTEFIIEKSNVRPQIEVVPSLSRMTRSGRQIVFQVENFEVIQCISADLFN